MSGNVCAVIGADCYEPKCADIVLRRGRCAFTLIELLVAVVIIALLIAILIPSLARSREQARITLCQTHLHELGTALTIYGGTDDRLVPGDGNMGHDVWNNPTEGPAGGTGCQPVNLGHLLAARVLPLPNSEQHPFYCPTLSMNGAKWSFTYRNSGPYAASAPRGFEGWGKPGRAVNIGYDYRDSIDGDPGDGLPVIATRVSQAARKVLVSDVFSWGTGQWAHRTRYNYVRGDGSVGWFRDTGAPAYLYWWFDPTHTNDDYFAFRVFEHGSVHGALWP